MSTTLRIALLAGLLALVSNLAVIGFIYYRTHDEAAATVHQQVIEQGKVLADVYRSGGKPALEDAIHDTMTYADPQTAVAVLGSDGHQIEGNLDAVPQSLLNFREGYRNALIRLRGQTTPREAALVMHELSRGRWLVSGRIAGEGLAICDTLERSLLIALLVAGLLGLLCGLILAHYVGQRIGEIAARRRSHQRARPVAARAGVERRRCFRSAGPPDQRDARPDQHADGGIAAAYR